MKGVIKMSPEILEPIKLEPEAEKVLRDMETNILVLEREIIKAKRAGIDVADLEQRFEEMKKLRVGLLREYT